MRRLLIEIGETGFLENKTNFSIRIETDKITKDMIKDILNSLEKALLQEVRDL